jgi:hypothetical protein
MSTTTEPQAMPHKGESTIRNGMPMTYRSSCVHGHDARDGPIPSGLAIRKTQVQISIQQRQ